MVRPTCIVLLVRLVLPPSVHALYMAPIYPLPAIEQVAPTSGTTASIYNAASTSWLSGLLDNPTTPAPTMKASTPAFTQPVDGSRPYVVAAFEGKDAQPPAFVPSDCAKSRGFRKAVLCPDLPEEEDLEMRERMMAGLERYRIEEEVDKLLKVNK